MTSPLATCITDWLAGQGGTVIARVNQYDPDHFNVRVNQAKAPFTHGSAELQLSGSTWRVSMETTAIDADAFDVAVVFRCVAGALSDASVSVDLEFSDWSVQNYVLMPAAAYDGNRFPSRRIPYSPKLWFADDIGPKQPIIVTDIPKLNERDGPSRIEERSGSMALPSIGFRSAADRSGIWLVTDQGNSLGDYGIGIEENRDRSQATLSITSPLVRELYSYRICDMRAPSVDVPENFKAGDVVKISFRLHAFAARDVQSLFDKFAEIRKPKATPRVDRLPFS
ncbi:hypothetical protein HQ447_12125, partial [bacterium]|nr:hypothetical protein [bacterium]